MRVMDSKTKTGILTLVLCLILSMVHAVQGTPVVEPVASALDVNNDCFIDLSDLRHWTTFWLETLSTGTVSSDGLMGHWPFDEGEGNIAGDLSGLDNELTISGATWTTGLQGGGLFFDGLDDFAERIDPDFTLGTDAWSVMAWIKTSGGDGSGKIVDWYRCGANPECFSPDSALYSLSTSSGNTDWHLRDDDAVWHRITDSHDLRDNRWHQLVGSMDPQADVMRLYVDGQFVEEKSTTLTSFSSGNITVPLSIGRRFIKGWGTPQQFYEGVIDEVRIYRRMLSALEVQLLYQEGLNIADADLNQDERIDLFDFGILYSVWLTQVPDCPLP